MSYRQKLFLLLFALLALKASARIYRIWHPPHAAVPQAIPAPRMVR